MRELIRGYAAATFETAAGASRLPAVHDELSGFARALVGHEDLHRVLTDAAVPEQARRGVVTELLEAKASPETLALVSFVIRVERPAELAPTLAGLVAMAAESDGQPEVATGRLAIRGRIRGYAERVLQELASSEEIDEVEDELFRVARLLDDHPDLRRVLAGNRPLDDRVAIADDLLAARTQPATMRLVRFVLRAGRIRDLVGTFEWLVDLAAAERGRRIGEVRTAVDLDVAERARLATALGRLVERPVEVRVIIDPTVIGGALVSVGDLVIDGTVRLRLERLRDLLAPAG